MLSSTRPRILPPAPALVRFAFFGALLAGVAYLAFALDKPRESTVDETPPVEPGVAVPQPDRTLLRTAADGTREQRLQLEAEPLRHLLGLAIDVGPTVAAALGMPGKPVPLATVRTEPDAWRGQWLWYEGTLENLAGPGDGHPIKGYSIYEATIRLQDGEHAMFAFSMPPAPEVTPGSWVRIEGFLLKLRDTNYPLDVASAPLLVGRQLQRDYEDWPPVTHLDRELLAKVDDSSFGHGDLVWRTIEEDQTEALWHLAAHARDTAGQRSLAEWRRTPALNAHDHHEQLRDGAIARGTPMRVIGTLIRRATIAAPPNPAGIEFWTVALVQVHEYGGCLIPIWVPKRVAELPLRAPLEVRAYYYRWFAYEARDDERRRAPLFVAADVEPQVHDVDPTMRSLSIGLAAIFTVLVGLVFWSQRRSARESLSHQRDMDARRRRRRERLAARPSAPPS